MLYCEQCGANVTRYDDFCTECGAELSARAVRGSQQGQTKNTSNKPNKELETPVRIISQAVVFYTFPIIIFMILYDLLPRSYDAAGLTIIYLLSLFIIPLLLVVVITGIAYCVVSGTRPSESKFFWSGIYISTFLIFFSQNHTTTGTGFSELFEYGSMEREALTFFQAFSELATILISVFGTVAVVTILLQVMAGKEKLSILVIKTIEDVFGLPDSVIEGVFEEIS